MAVAFVQVGGVGHGSDGVCAAVTVIVCPGLPLATYTVCEAPGLFVVEVTPPADTDATPITVTVTLSWPDTPPAHVAVTVIDLFAVEM